MPYFALRPFTGGSDMFRKSSNHHYTMAGVFVLVLAGIFGIGRSLAMPVFQIGSGAVTITDRLATFDSLTAFMSVEDLQTYTESSGLLAILAGDSEPWPVGNFRRPAFEQV
jgi:hypothetical protein